MLGTPRLLLRELSAHDRDVVALMLGDAEVMRCWPAPLVPGPRSRDGGRRGLPRPALGAAGRARVIALIRPENGPSLAVARRRAMQPGKRTLYAGYAHVVYTAGRKAPLPVP